jgi:hypothetical protein
MPKTAATATIAMPSRDFFGRIGGPAGDHWGGCAP